MVENKQLLQTIVHTLDNKKAKDIQVIKIDEVTVLCDYFVICSGTSNTQVKALSDEVEKILEEKYELSPTHTEGYNGGNWVLLDYDSIMVHVFYGETREFYNLERLWSEGTPMDVTALIEEAENNAL